MKRARRSRSCLLLAVPLLLSAGAPRAGEMDRWAGRIVAELDETRERSGAGGLERRPALARAARDRAKAIAALPEGRRLSLGVSLGQTLRDAGVDGYYRAWSHLDLQTGLEDPPGSLLERWRGAPTQWREAVDPNMDAVGVGMVRARDGWLVTVVILVADQRFSEEDPVPPSNDGKLEGVVLEAVNRERARHGLPALIPERRLGRAARGHSRDMAARGYLAHESPEGRDMAWRAREAGVSYRRIAENIAYNERVRMPAEEAVKSWMESPGHRKNILGEAYTHTGVGVARNRDGRIYFTQLFMLPR